MIPAEELITPDDVRGGYPTLEAAVLAGAWPTLDSSRGKVIFLMDQRNVGPVNLQGHPSLKGRVLFTHAAAGEPDAAFIERNDGPAQEITALVRKGYLVRARMDAETKEARANSTARRDAMMRAAFNCSAPIILLPSQHAGRVAIRCHSAAGKSRSVIPSTVRRFAQRTWESKSAWGTIRPRRLIRSRDIASNLGRRCRSCA